MSHYLKRDRVGLATPTSLLPITTMDSRLDNRDPKLLQGINYLDLNPGSSIRSAAKISGANRSTIARQLVRPTSRVLAKESSQRFSWRHERFLADWIKEEDARGHAPGRSRVLEMAQKLLRANGDDKPLGRKWIDGFKRRNSDVKTLIGKKIASERHNGASIEGLNAHFQRFKLTIDTYAVKERNIWNMDETGTQLGASIATKVLGNAKKKSTIVKKPNETEWVSVIECVSAAGKATRPLIVFKGKSVQLQWFNSSEVPDWQYTTSTNGWTSNDIALKWLKSINRSERRSR
jgi:4-hydroxybenzoate polyprenyltransferase